MSSSIPSNLFEVVLKKFHPEIIDDDKREYQGTTSTHCVSKNTYHIFLWLLTNMTEFVCKNPTSFFDSDFVFDFRFGSYYISILMAEDRVKNIVIRDNDYAELIIGEKI